MRPECTFFVLSVCLAAAVTTPSCKSDSGSNVDFAYSFKYPQGWDYAYMDSDHALSKSSHSLNSASSSISATIMQMHNSGVSHMMWNDEPPKKSKSKAPYAHSKGLLLFTGSGGIWLTHSLPNFPTDSATSASGLYSEASDDFGQSYLCITVTADEIHNIAQMLNITRPTIYATKLEDKDSWPDLVTLTGRGSWDTNSVTTTPTIRSKGGQTFHVYGKSGDWGKGKDLYRDLVAPSAGKLEMEGWRMGRGVWGPACGKDEVLDVMNVDFPEKSWDVLHDHSKWAVALTGTSFCVGDLNRADGQDMRGGATVCIQSSHFAGIMRKVVSSTDKCRSVSNDASVTPTDNVLPVVV